MMFAVVLFGYVGEWEEMINGCTLVHRFSETGSPVMDQPSQLHVKYFVREKNVSTNSTHV